MYLRINGVGNLQKVDQTERENLGDLQLTESKQLSMERQHSTSPMKVKLKQTILAWKISLT